MKQIDAISQPLEHGYKKLVFKRNSRMRLHQKIWGGGHLCLLYFWVHVFIAKD
jgi:hypothetical protein